MGARPNVIPSINKGNKQKAFITGKRKVAHNLILRKSTLPHGGSTALREPERCSELAAMTSNSAVRIQTERIVADTGKRA